MASRFRPVKFGELVLHLLSMEKTFISLVAAIPPETLFIHHSNGWIIYGGKQNYYGDK